MKIDFHVHITPPDIIENWKSIAKKEDYFKLLSESPVNKFATAEDVVDELERSGVDKAVVFGFAFRDMELCKYVNDYVANSVSKYPDKLVGYMVVPPTYPNIESEIGRCISNGLKGVGELFPYGQDFDISNQKEMSLLSNICIEEKLPILIHTNEPIGHNYSGKTDTTPIKASIFAENFPEIKVIFAHWGGGLLFYELMPEIKKQNKNVYYDTAASPLLYNKNIYKTAHSIDILDKILFGSDFPLLPMERYLKEIEQSGLTQDEQALITGNNAYRLLKGYK